MRKWILRFIYSFLIRGFLKLIVGVKFDNANFLLDGQQFILVANHNSHLDTMTLLASLPAKILHKVKPVAAADHFGKNKLQEKLSHYFINALLIPRKRDREHPENDPVNKMIRSLDEGFSLILFPEGTRGEPEKEQSLKPGVALVLIQRPHIRYVPAYLKGMGKAMPKGDSLIVPFNSSLVFGSPRQINNTVVEDILNQISQDFQELKKIK